MPGLRLAIRRAAEINRAKTQEHGLENLLFEDDCEVSSLDEAHGTPSAVAVSVDGRIASSLSAGAVAIEALAENWAVGGLKVVRPSANGAANGHHAARHLPALLPTRLPCQPLHQLAHHLLVGGIREQRHRERVVDDHPRRQTPLPLLLPPRLRHHPIQQIWRENARQHPDRDVIREALIGLRLDPARPRHATTTTRPPDANSTVLASAPRQRGVSPPAHAPRR